MPSRRCSTCAINYPASVRQHNTCAVCGDPTTYFRDLEPHKDWEDRIKAAVWEPDSSELKVSENRLARFRASGLDIGRAMLYAGDRGVDLHLFEKLIEEGCPLDTAARIVAPCP